MASATPKFQALIDSAKAHLRPPNSVFTYQDIQICSADTLAIYTLGRLPELTTLDLTELTIFKLYRLTSTRAPFIAHRPAIVYSLSIGRTNIICTEPVARMLSKLFPEISPSVQGDTSSEQVTVTSTGRVETSTPDFINHIYGGIRVDLRTASLLSEGHVFASPAPSDGTGYARKSAASRFGVYYTRASAEKDIAPIGLEFEETDAASRLLAGVRLTESEVSILYEHSPFFLCSPEISNLCVTLGLVEIYTGSLRVSGMQQHLYGLTLPFFWNQVSMLNQTFPTLPFTYMRSQQLRTIPIALSWARYLASVESKLILLERCFRSQRSLHAFDEMLGLHRSFYASLVENPSAFFIDPVPMRQYFSSRVSQMPTSFGEEQSDELDSDDEAFSEETRQMYEQGRQLRKREVYKQATQQTETSRSEQAHSEAAT